MIFDFSLGSLVNFTQSPALKLNEYIDIIIELYILIIRTDESITVLKEILEVVQEEVTKNFLATF